MDGGRKRRVGERVVERVGALMCPHFLLYGWNQSGGQLSGVWGDDEYWGKL